MGDLWATLLQKVDRWESRKRSLPVTPRLSQEEIRERLRRFDFSSPVDLAGLVEEVADLLEQGTVHPTHPRYFGLFNPGTLEAGIAADAIAALYNPQLAAWWHSPAANEIERLMLDYMVRRLGMEGPGTIANFTTGGSEANLSGVVAALVRVVPGFADRGLTRSDRPPVFYVSDQAHDSFVKIALTTGLGRGAVRRIRSDGQQKLEVGELRRAIARDRGDGCLPFLVVATVGTTATGAIDPLPELAALCHEEGLWLHADAAWGGLAVLSDRLRHCVAGLERADSVTWDAHKTLPVPMSAGMFFCRWRPSVESAFSVQPGYVQDAQPGTSDQYQYSIQWSRRFIGLKVFFTMAGLGAGGVADMVDHQADMAQHLRAELRRGGWRVTNHTPLPLVCFTRDQVPAELMAKIARSVADEGTAWVSEVRLPDGARWLRACITNHATGPRDVGMLVEALNRAVEQVRGA